MYQYKARLKNTDVVIAEAHTIQELENQIVHYRRGQKHGEHTNMNNEIEIIHVLRDKVHGSKDSKEKLVKVV